MSAGSSSSPADEVSNAIKTSKNSKATGMDMISPIMLKHIGPYCNDFLLSMLNLSLTRISAVWKTEKLIPIAKSNTPMLNRTVSYRPVITRGQINEHPVVVEQHQHMDNVADTVKYSSTPQ